MEMSIQGFDLKGKIVNLGVIKLDLSIFVGLYKESIIAKVTDKLSKKIGIAENVIVSFDITIVEP